MADHLPAHVAHVHRRNETLERKMDKLREKARKAAHHGIRTVEVAAGALVGGLIQGMAKDPSQGAKILHLPADVTIAAALKLCAFTDLAGEEYSEHLSAFGDGFLGAAASDLGFHLGLKRKATGSFFAKGVALPPAAPPPGLPAAPPPGAPAVASGDPQAMAQQLLAQMQR